MSSWGHIDGRFMEGRCRHNLQEYTELQKLGAQEAKIIVVGAAFIGVEWVTALEYFSSDAAFFLDLRHRRRLRLRLRPFVWALPRQYNYMRRPRREYIYMYCSCTYTNTLR